MTTPAGWYDDGSGRQRWWDGQQWTEHFAPETAAESPAESSDSAEAGASEPVAASEPAVAETHEPSLDDTWVRPSAETEISPENGQGPDVSEPVPAEAASEAYSQSASAEPTPAAAPLGDHAASVPAETPSYAAAPPSYAPPAPSYPGAASADQPGAAYAAPGGGYPGSTPYGTPAPEGPQKVSVLGLVGLGLSVLGTILVFIPVVGFVGFFLLAAGFIVSLISLFLKGKKWPGISGLVLAVVGTILGVVMSFVYLFAFAQGVSEELDRPSFSATSTPAPEESDGTDTGTSTGARPTSAEVATGLTTLIEATGAEGYTPEQITCFADEFVASSIDDETLRKIADSDGTFTDSEAASAFAEEFGDAIPVCLVP